MNIYIDMKEIIFFVTHIFNKEIENRYIKLKSELGDKYDICITGTNTKAIPHKYLWEFIEIKMEEFYNTGGEIFWTGGYLWNCHLTPYLLKKSKPNYIYYWFIEFDVIFTGNWNFVFDKLQKDNSDLVCTHIYNYTDDLKINKLFWENSNFIFWKSLVLPTKYEHVEKVRAFLPFYRISSRWIDVIEKIINEKWIWHFEILLPTALVINKMSISQFWWYSLRYTPKSRRGLFYRTYPADAYIWEFRYRPPHLLYLKKNCLYHPVKKMPVVKIVKNYCKQLIILYKTLRYFYIENWVWKIKTKAK